MGGDEVEEVWGKGEEGGFETVEEWTEVAFEGSVFLLAVGVWIRRICVWVWVVVVKRWWRLKAILGVESEWVVCFERCLSVEVSCFGYEERVFTEK